MAGVIVQWNSVTTLVGLCTFLVHTRLLGRTITASQGFTSLSLFGILRFPLVVLPNVINFYLQVRFCTFVQRSCTTCRRCLVGTGGKTPVWRCVVPSFRWLEYAHSSVATEMSARISEDVRSHHGHTRRLLSRHGHSLPSRPSKIPEKFDRPVGVLSV